VTLDKESLRFTETAHERLLELEHETDLARVSFTTVSAASMPPAARCARSQSTSG
jgi:hypothetical protein